MIKSFSSPYLTVVQESSGSRGGDIITTLQSSQSITCRRNCVLSITIFSFSCLSLLYLQHRHTELDCLVENHYGKVTEDEKQGFKKIAVCYLVITVSGGRCEMGTISR